jgi:Tfp pilus assembly protein PilV
MRHRKALGFTVLEVLVASALTCGVLATLGLWTFRANWNQAALHRQHALEMLRAGIDHHASSLPVAARSWSEQPEENWRLDWMWSPTQNGGWRLQGRAFGPKGRAYGTLWVMRWARR